MAFNRTLHVEAYLRSVGERNWRLRGAGCPRPRGDTTSSGRWTVGGDTHAEQVLGLRAFWERPDEPEFRLVSLWCQRMCGCSCLFQPSGGVVVQVPPESSTSSNQGGLESFCKMSLSSRDVRIDGQLIVFGLFHTPQA